MSDISVLSHEYKTASEFSQSITKGLILIKKYYLGLPAADSISSQELEERRHEVATILLDLAQRLDPEKGYAPETDETVRIPSAVLTQLRTKRRGDLDYFREDLRRIAEVLQTLETKLSAGDLDLLDQVAGIADDQASHLFRKLMRK